MIDRRLRALLPKDVGVGLQRLDLAGPPPWANEDVTLARAVSARRMEFAAGRAAARAAMAQIGVLPCAIPVRPDRAPEWPSGLCGSISHGGSQAGAIVSRRTDWAGLGLDLEPAAPMAADLADLVRHPGDQDATGLPPELAATLCFGVKEAAFKAQFPLIAQWLDYRDIAMTVTPDRFQLMLKGVRLQGQWFQEDGMFVSVLLISLEQGRQLGGLGPDIMPLQDPLPGDLSHLR
ncbi:MAG: phosphopantetheinyl transferase [Alphaproteobacteria bacterium]|nr:phosphopantetheinyl transferase [Alphaproteobacteria bacterium]